MFGGFFKENPTTCSLKKRSDGAGVEDRFPFPVILFLRPDFERRREDEGGEE
jgi:hypothetical protein